MRAAIATLLLAATLSGCYARNSQGGVGPITRSVQQPTPDLANERADTNKLPTAQR
jgi:hypothetical protein